MSVLAIVQPITLGLGPTAGFASASLALSPDPKEAAYYAAGGDGYIDLDLGAPTTIDTIFLGYTNLPSAAPPAIRGGLVSSTDANIGDGLFHGYAADFGTPQHFIVSLAAPVAVRYLRISGVWPAGATLGVLAVGLAFRPTLPQEFGSGRQLTDTGNVQRLMAGGFAIDPGVVVGDWQWTLSDLSDIELRKLWALARSRGQTRSVLVIEDPDLTVGLNERIHWGLFGKLDAYERRDVNLNRWAMSIQDWG